MAFRHAEALATVMLGCLRNTTRWRAGAMVRSMQSSWWALARQGVEGGARPRFGGPPGRDGPCFLAPLLRPDAWR